MVHHTEFNIKLLNYFLFIIYVPTFELVRLCGEYPPGLIIGNIWLKSKCYNYSRNYTDRPCLTPTDNENVVIAVMRL